MTTEKIKQIEKEIAETKEKLLSIIRPLYDKDENEIIEIRGKDMLFYGDCCQKEAKLQILKECQADEKRKVDELGEIRELFASAMVELDQDYDKKILQRHFREALLRLDKVFSEGK